MNYREFKTKGGKAVLCGRNAKQNESLVNEFLEKENILIHTIAPGSPFCVISDLEASKRDIKEAAVICAKYSRAWRDNKNDVTLHFFTGKDVYKRKGMKLGTFGVNNAKEIKIKKRRISKFENAD